MIPFEEFALPFGGNLDASNRWVQLATIIPWEKFEDRYAQCFSQDEKRGDSALPFRVGLGALLIRERLGVTDREAVEQIRENLYLQYFLGFERFTSQKPFDPSLYVYFRTRITQDILAAVNEEIVKAQVDAKGEKALQAVKIGTKQHRSDRGRKSGDDAANTGGSGGNRGKLIIDSPCAPADRAYPQKSRLSVMDVRSVNAL